MKHRLQELIDLEVFQNLQDRLNEICSFPSAIIDNDGVILTATAWQDLCTQFHRKNKDCEQACIQSDQHIRSHLHEANPAVTYRCPHGLVDNATPIIIDGIHYGNFFTGQFFMEKPDTELFRAQARKYGFDEDAYLAAVKRVPIWTQEQLDSYLLFIKELIAVIAESGLKHLGEVETRKQIEENEERHQTILRTAMDGFWLVDTRGRLLEVNETYCQMSGYSAQELLAMGISDLGAGEGENDTAAHIQHTIAQGESRFETRHRRKDGSVFDVEVSVQYRPDGGGRLTAFLRDITDRKRAEEAISQHHREMQETAQRLDQSRGMLQLIIESIPIRVFWKDNNLRYLGCNTLFAHDAGFSHPDQLLYKDDSVMAWKDQADLYRTDDRQVIETRRPKMNIVEPQSTPAGSLIWLNTSKVPLQMPDGEVLGVLGVYEDITDRKLAEEELRTSQIQLEEAAGLARIAYWEHDEAAGEFTFNDAFYELFGTTATREGGYRMAADEYRRRFVHPDDLEDLRRQVDENKSRPRTGDFEQYEHRAIRRDGEVIHILNRNRAVTDPEGRVLKVVGVNQDITARKKMEEALRESETKLRAIFDGSRDAVCVAREGAFTFANPAHATLFGYESPDELVGTPVTDLLAPVSRGLVGEMIGKRARGEPAPSFYEATGLRKDGTTFLMENSASTYMVKGEQFTLAVLRDITEKRKLEEQLRQAQKMEAVGTLAGGVAHDFNNILTVIMGFSHLIKEEIGADDHLGPYLDQVITSSERAADLTQRLLAFSRKQRITLEPHEVNGVVMSTASLLTRLLPEDIVLTMHLTDGDTYSLLDVTQIGQVLMNLATNARDAMPHGGSLTITTQRATLDETFRKTHGFGAPGEYMGLTITDTGVGMDGKTLERIFDPFFTTKEVGKGTGLGLASVYGTVKQHQGYITVWSEPFKGTTFDIYLPLIPPPPRQEVSSAGDTRRGAETILIVEDDRDVRRMLVSILESHGYTTLEAVNGDDALRLHHAHKDRIDLVILDVVMPGKHGREVLDEMTRIDPGVRAIFASGYTGDTVLLRGVRSESVDFLQKPLSVATLLAKVREVLDR